MNESNENTTVTEQANSPESGPVIETVTEANFPESPSSVTQEAEKNPELEAGNPGETAQTKGTPPSDSAPNPGPDPAPEQNPRKKTDGARPSGRNFEAEWKELAEAHPEVVGTTLPQDIFQACITSDKPPLQVYESMMLQHLQSELAQLKQENDRLRQNADNAQRAPVTGTAAGGSAHTEEEDPFVAAFRRYR